LVQYLSGPNGFGFGVPVDANHLDSAAFVRWTRFANQVTSDNTRAAWIKRKQREAGEGGEEVGEDEQHVQKRARTMG